MLRVLLYVLTEEVRMGIGVRLSRATFEVLVVEIQMTTRYNSKTITSLRQFSIMTLDI